MRKVVDKLRPFARVEAFAPATWFCSSPFFAPNLHPYPKRHLTKICAVREIAIVNSNSGARTHSPRWISDGFIFAKLASKSILFFNGAPISPVGRVINRYYGHSHVRVSMCQAILLQYMLNINNINNINNIINNNVF